MVGIDKNNENNLNFVQYNAIILVHAHGHFQILYFICMKCGQQDNTSLNCNISVQKFTDNSGR